MGLPPRRGGELEMSVCSWIPCKRRPSILILVKRALLFLSSFPKMLSPCPCAAVCLVWSRTYGRAAFVGRKCNATEPEEEEGKAGSAAVAAQSAPHPPAFVKKRGGRVGPEECLMHKLHFRRDVAGRLVSYPRTRPENGRQGNVRIGLLGLAVMESFNHGFFPS